MIFILKPDLSPNPSSNLTLVNSYSFLNLESNSISSKSFSLTSQWGPWDLVFNVVTNVSSIRIRIIPTSLTILLLLAVSSKSRFSTINYSMELWKQYNGNFHFGILCTKSSILPIPKSYKFQMFQLTNEKSGNITIYKFSNKIIYIIKKTFLSHQIP